MEDDRSLTAKEKRQEQITRWKNSATDLECPTYANPKVRVKFDDGAVFLAACSSGDLDEVRILLKNGADINFANVDGLTALHQACIDGNVEVVEFLVEHGSEIDQEDNEGWTPLHATASCGFMDIAKYLVKKGANVAAVNSEAELPIDIAEEDEMVEYLQSEIDNKGIDVDEARDIERLFMLEDANILLDKYQNGEKVEIYRHSKSGATALHICAAKGYNDVLKILIKAGIDVNSRDHDGWTPLHAASHWSQEESSKILADRNADFKSRSNLGQTPFDVADEDMLEYLRDLETEQSENKPNIKTTPVIEPPPLKSDKKSSPSTKESSDILRINEMQNGEKRSRKMLEEESPDSSSSEEEEDSITSATRISSPPPIKSHETKSSSRTSSLSNDQSDDFISSYNSRRNRPASLHISSSEPPHHRPLQMTNSEGGSKPIAATQPVQAVGRTSRENGSRTTLLSRDKDDTPSAWRTGLRKTGSFDEKSKISMQNLQNKEIERSSSYSTRFSEETKNETKTARVAPILDASKSKTDAETDESNDLLSRFGRRKYDTNQSATTDPTPDTSASFKRSISYKKAVGRTESLENHDDANIEALTKRPKTFSKISEDDSEKESPTTTTTASNDAAAAASKSVDSRRSHLQPVRDEEAEAQRRIRSRRERQTRRSTQGVTLDVVEEAMRTIGQFRKQKPATDKTSTDTPDSRTDTSSTYLRGSDDTQQPASSSSQSSYFTNTATSSSTPVTSLPSGYIPSDQRVKGGAESASTSSNSKSAALSVPSISVDPTVSEGENDKGDKSSGENGLSAAQKRRRNRKERRSTGIPDAKPSSTATEDFLRSPFTNCQESIPEVEEQDYSSENSNQVSSPASLNNSTPETDLEWLRNLGKVTLRRRAVQFSGKSSGRFSHKESFKRRSIECDLHPTALARKNGIEDLRELSPVRAASSKRPYGGYFTRDSLTPLKNYSPRYSSSFLELRDFCVPKLNPQRRISFDAGSPLINHIPEIIKSTKRLRMFDKNSQIFKPVQAGSTPPTSEKPLSVKKLGKSVKELSACFKVDDPVINFAQQITEKENELPIPFQFKGGGEGGVISKTKSPSVHKSDKSRLSAKLKKVRDILWPPQDSSIYHTKVDLVKRKLSFQTAEKDESVEYESKGDMVKRLLLTIFCCWF
uniref:protein phosphatase 1 regulatory subunit 12A-like isoform X3 n=1 Tax=Styela clava TaxID=7725 RepID=UPI00193AB522|nr:protein phosphatase 1 regulatory subunit 12A-like isoform X3 [Styela clava]